MSRENQLGNRTEIGEIIKPGEITVVKVGGGDGNRLDLVIEDMADLFQYGPFVLVHGASAQTNRLTEQLLGRPPEFVTTVSEHQSRRTTREVLEIYMMACGKINAEIVERFQQLGINAIGLTGLDGGLLRGTKKLLKVINAKGGISVLRDDYTGTIEQVNAGLLKSFIDNGFIPVIAPLALSEKNEAMNVDGDRAAAAIAVALGARRLVILSNVEGYRESYPNGPLVPRLTPEEASELALDPNLGRFRPKFLATTEALKNGVPEVIFADAQVESPITKALMGGGTRIEGPSL